MTIFRLSPKETIYILVISKMETTIRKRIKKMTYEEAVKNSFKENAEGHMELF